MKIFSLQRRKGEELIFSSLKHGKDNAPHLSKGIQICFKDLDLTDIKEALTYLLSYGKTWGSESDYDESRKDKELNIFQDEYGYIKIKAKGFSVFMSKCEAQRVLNELNGNPRKSKNIMQKAVEWTKSISIH